MSPWNPWLTPQLLRKCDGGPCIDEDRDQQAMQRGRHPHNLKLAGCRMMSDIVSNYSLIAQGYLSTFHKGSVTSSTPIQKI